MTFTDTDFFLRQREEDKGWRVPLVLAVALHLFAFSSSALMPKLFHRQPILDEVVTVNLVSLPDTAPPIQETPPQQARPEPQPKPVEPVEPVKAKVTVAPEPQVVQEAPPVKPVSLEPIKRKVRKTDPAEIAAQKARREQEIKRLQELARAELEEERARQAAERARTALAEMIRRQGVKTSEASRSSSGRREVQSIVLKQYLSSLDQRVRQHWILPEMRQWDPDLKTRVVLTIRRDGTVVNTTIEQKSNDPFYDQFVMNTLQKAMPMPPFPTLMPESSIEVGLIFRPGELSM